MMEHLSLVPYEGAASGGGGAGGGKYKECMRNHAAAMGGQAFDGCGEYMASSSPPDSLHCAACGCHRSFHRRASASIFSSSATVFGSCAPPLFFRPPPPPPLALPAPPTPTTPTPPQTQQHFHPHHQHHPQHPSHAAALQAFLPTAPMAIPVPSHPAPHLALPYHAVPPSAAGAAAHPPPWLAHQRSGSETPPRHDEFGLIGVGGFMPGSGGGTGNISGSGSLGRKRFRTKFTAEQKERMREFAEKQGWRINRNDDGALDRFCDEIGVKRQVLKVWMHNHKNQLASSNSPTSVAAAAAAAAAGMGIGIGVGPGADGAGAGTGTGHGVGVGDDDDDDDTDDSPPRAAVSSPSPSPISV